MWTSRKRAARKSPPSGTAQATRKTGSATSDARRASRTAADWERGSVTPLRRWGRGGEARAVLTLRPRLPDDGVQRGAPVERRFVRKCRLHEEAPDRRGEGAAGDGDPVHVLHRDLALGVADPNRRLQLRRVAREPGIGVVVGRAGLS